MRHGVAFSMANVAQRISCLLKLPDGRFPTNTLQFSNSNMTWSQASTHQGATTNWTYSSLPKTSLRECPARSTSFFRNVHTGRPKWMLLSLLTCSKKVAHFHKRRDSKIASGLSQLYIGGLDTRSTQGYLLEMDCKGCCMVGTMWIKGCCFVNTLLCFVTFHTHTFNSGWLRRRQNIGCRRSWFINFITVIYCLKRREETQSGIKNFELSNSP